MFSTFGMSSRHSWMAPWTPWIDIKIRPPIFFKKVIQDPCLVKNDHLTLSFDARTHLELQKITWSSILSYYDSFSSYRMPVQAWTRLDISILLINLSWIAQMMLGPIQNCRKLLGVQSCLNMVLFRAIGYPFMPKQGSTAKYKVAKFKIWQGRAPKSPNAK